MLLSENEVQRSLERAKAAFPRFANWKYNNEADEEHSGFALWGEYVRESDSIMGEHFFVTLDTHEETWKGHLSVGQHAYFWTSADFGDAYLVDTDACATLEEAIETLKKQIASLLRAFLS